MTMKRFTKILLVTCLFAICVLQCSCSLFLYDNARFSGGEALDDRLVAEIKNELFDSDTHSEKPSVEKDSDLKNDGNTENTDDGSTETSASVGKENSSETEISQQNVVYWTKSGSVWHSYIDCGHIKNSNNILSGTVEEAVNEGKSHLCKNCDKRGGA